MIYATWSHRVKKEGLLKIHFFLNLKINPSASSSLRVKRFFKHGEGRLTNSNLFRTYQPILIEFTMVVYEKIYLAA